MSTPSSTEPETPIVDDVSSQGGEVTVAPGAGKDPEIEVVEGEVVDEGKTVDEGDVADGDLADDAFDDEFADDESADDESVVEGPRDRYATLFPLIGSMIGLVAVIAVLVITFALPAAKGGPNRIPIGIAGTAQVTGQLETLFSSDGASTAFDVTTYPRETDLRSAILHRKVYGGLSVTESGATMFVASAASPTISDALNSVASELSTQTQVQFQVTDLVAMPSQDPRGAGLGGASLPLALAGVLPAALIALLYRRRPAAQFGAAIGASVLAGLVLTLLLSSVIGATRGSNFWAVAPALGVGVLAGTLLLLGLNALTGRIGLGIGAAVLVLIAEPLSGLASAPEWLPRPWGAIGQFLPAGAEATLLRSTAFFDGHGGGRALLVLGMWSLVGLLLMLVAVLVGRPDEAPTPVADAEKEPATIAG